MIFQLLNEEQPYCMGLIFSSCLSELLPLEENRKGRCEPREFSCTKKDLVIKLPFSSHKPDTPDTICEGKRICCNGNKTPACKTNYFIDYQFFFFFTIKEATIRCKC